MSITICFDFGNTRLKAAIFKEEYTSEKANAIKNNISELPAQEFM